MKTWKFTVDTGETTKSSEVTAATFGAAIRKALRDALSFGRTKGEGLISIGYSDPDRKPRVTLTPAEKLAAKIARDQKKLEALQG